MSETDYTWNTYRPLTGAQLLDTVTAGTPLTSSTPLTVQVTGNGGVPATGVIAVVLDVTTTNSQSSSPVTVAALGDEPGITNHFTTPGHQARTTAYVAPGADGHVRISTDGAATDLAVAVNGYFTDAGPGASFVPAPAAARLLDTRATAALAPGASATIHLPEQAPPATTAAAFDVETTGAARPGSLSATDPASGQTVEVAYDTITASTGLVAAVSGAGELVVRNDGPSATQVAVDLQGYFVPETEGGALVTTPGRAYDTRAEMAPIPPGGVLEVPVAGTGEVPLDGIDAYAIAVTVFSGAAAGHAQVYSAGHDPSSTATVAFQAGDRRTSSAIISTVYPFSPYEVAIKNRSAAEIHVVVDVMGYFEAALPEYVPADDVGPMAVAPAGPQTSSQTCVVPEVMQEGATWACISTDGGAAETTATPGSEPTDP